MTEKYDPYEVQPLERAVNESAIRVSTIWVTYLIFGFYLATTIGNVTSRQLLVAESIRLPVLNIELPIVGFFFLAPILFVILHVYVLIQLVLLGRTAATYNEAVTYHFKIKADQDRLRQRLANTLFAQMFAGSPREREGLLGALLKGVAWVVMIIFPIILLLAFELKFLAFHSHALTWWHRALVALDLLALLLLWSSAANPQRDVDWHVALETRSGVTYAVGVLAIACIVLTFPGEFIFGWVGFDTARPERPETVSYRDFARRSYCDKKTVLAVMWSPTLDRFNFEGMSFVDHDRLQKLESNSKQSKASTGERTLDLSGRDLSCGNFRGVDLRRADLSNSKLIGAIFDNAKLQGAWLDHTDLTGASLAHANLSETDLSEALLHGADLDRAQITDALLDATQFQGANLFAAAFYGSSIMRTQFQGANLIDARLIGVFLNAVSLEGADLRGARLYAATLKHSQLEAATFDNAGLQAAIFQGSNIEAASFKNARLQGVRFLESNEMALSDFSEAFLWHAETNSCDGAQISEPNLDPVIGNNPYHKDQIQFVPATGEGVNTLVDEITSLLPDKERSHTEGELRSRLNATETESATDADKWYNCAKDKLPAADYARKRNEYFVQLACRNSTSAKYIAERLILRVAESKEIIGALADGMLGADGELCRGAKEIRTSLKSLLLTVRQRKRDGIR
jgi:uncharacterized protein YjbI with pentapeptide repeats